MLSLPFAARRLAIRHVHSPLPTLRRASTRPSAKSQIKQAFTNPAPPVLARYPRVYHVARTVKVFVGLVLGLHIFAEYFFTLSQAEGISMLPTVNGTGDWLLLSKRYRRGRDIEVGDLVSFKHPVDEGVFGVKRVIGMPGDFVLRDSPDTSGAMIQVSGTRARGEYVQLLIDLMQIPEGHCYVVGDNLKYSRDSRMFGPLPLGLIKAKVTGILSTSELKWSNLKDDGLRSYSPEDID
ncbi:hypothetical protein Q7P37_002121 [Cladosporium fusiforme]